MSYYYSRIKFFIPDFYVKIVANNQNVVQRLSAGDRHGYLDPVSKKRN